MPNPSKELTRKLLRTLDIAGQRINVWRPEPLSGIIPLILPYENPPIFVPQLDVMKLALPDPERFRITDIHSDDEVRGVLRKGSDYPLRVRENVDYVLYRGRVMKDTIEEGVSLPRDSRFVLLQAFFDHDVLDQELKRINDARLKEIEDAKKKLTKKELDRYSGKIRLL